MSINSELFMAIDECNTNKIIEIIDNTSWHLPFIYSVIRKKKSSAITSFMVSYKKTPRKNDIDWAIEQISDCSPEEQEYYLKMFKDIHIINSDTILEKNNHISTQHIGRLSPNINLPN